MAEKKKPAKKAEPVHVVREWRSSATIFGPLRSKSNEDISENPSYHPPIRLTSRGTFVDEQLRPLDPKTVPAYILAEAKKTSLDIEFHPPKRYEGTTRDAMRRSGVEDPTGFDLNG